MKVKDIKTLQNRFELYYKEFKNYENFVNSNIEEQKKGMPERIQKLWENNASEDELISFNTHTKILPQIYGKDLNALKEKLLVAYDMSEGIIEISAEVKTEMENLHKMTDKPMYIVKEGKAIPVDEERINTLLSIAKAPQYLKQALEIVTNMKNMAEFKGE